MRTEVHDLGDKWELPPRPPWLLLFSTQHVKSHTMVLVACGIHTGEFGRGVARWQGRYDRKIMSRNEVEKATYRESRLDNASGVVSLPAEPWPVITPHLLIFTDVLNPAYITASHVHRIQSDWQRSYCNVH